MVNLVAAKSFIDVKVGERAPRGAPESSENNAGGATLLCSQLINHL
jgi:hypothetical protein